MMNGGAYYNEIEPYAADWLENLIRAGHIAPGDVDRRSIVDVRPDDLTGYRQCHFFAGLGGWPYALRLAGWADDRPAWTGSCPCQPLSSAGQRKGHADERHLWPAFYALIAECRPATVFGEQVASPLGREWLAGVRADLEGDGYAVGAADLSVAGVGAPHIRQRLFWVADAGRLAGHAEHGHQSREGSRRVEAEADAAGIGERVGPCRLADAGHDGRPARLAGCEQKSEIPIVEGCERDCAPRLLGDAYEPRPQGRSERRDGSDQRPVGPTDMAGSVALADGGDASAEGLQRGGEHGLVAEDGRVGELGDAGSSGSGRNAGTIPGAQAQGDHKGCEPGCFTDEPQPASADGRPRPPHGFWRDSDWLLCRDGKWRPVEPGTFPLASGLPARVARLRAAGNSIVAPLAAEFIGAVMDCAP